MVQLSANHYCLYTNTIFEPNLQKDGSPFQMFSNFYAKQTLNRTMNKNDFRKFESNSLKLYRHVHGICSNKESGMSAYASISEEKKSSNAEIIRMYFKT